MKKSSWASKLYALFLATLPLVSIYRLPGTSLALATVLTLVMLLYAVAQVATRKRKVSFMILFPFVLYIGYIMTMSPILFAILSGAVLIHIFAICTEAVNIQYLRRVIEFISVVAAICVIFQQTIHLFTGVHIPFYISNLLTEGTKDSYSWVLTTGFSDRSNMYRPSAFFLEPSHFTQYCMIGLGSCLFEQIPNIKKAVLISLGILATTSGMGIIAVVAMWTWWGLSNQRSGHRSIFGLRVFGVFLFLVLSYFVLDNISVTHNAMARFTTDSGAETNAISGRLFWWDTYFGNFDLIDFLRGYGLESLPDEQYFTGFMKQLYCYGVIGVSLLLLFLIILISISDNLGKGCCALYTGLLFFSELTGYHNLLFFIGILLTFYVNKEVQRRLSLRKKKLVSPAVITPEK